jgi:hypothetical protein
MHGNLNVKTKLYFHTYINSKTPLIRKPAIQVLNYPDRLGPAGKIFKNSTKLNFLDVTGYPSKYSTVLRLLELQIKRGRKVQTQLRAVICNTRRGSQMINLLAPELFF